MRIRFEEYSQAHEMPVQSAMKEEARQKHTVSFRSTLEETTQHGAQDGRHQARGAAEIGEVGGATAAHIPAYGGALDAVRRRLRASVGIALETIQDKDESKVFVAAVRRGGPAANAVPPLLVRLVVAYVARAMHSLCGGIVGGRQLAHAFACHWMFCCATWPGCGWP